MRGMAAVGRGLLPRAAGRGGGGGRRSKTTVMDVLHVKRKGRRKLTMVTAYDYPSVSSACLPACLPAAEARVFAAGWF